MKDKPGGVGFEGLKSWTAAKKAPEPTRDPVRASTPSKDSRGSTTPAAGSSHGTAREPMALPAKRPSTQRNAEPSQSSPSVLFAWMRYGVATLAIVAIIWMAVWNWPPRTAPVNGLVTNLEKVLGDDLGEADPEPVTVPAYVVATVANVRYFGSEAAPVIAQLPEWSEVLFLGGTEEWSHIQFATPDGPAEGYVSRLLIHAGTAHDARVAYCEVGAGGSPFSGEVLSQSRRGSHSIKVNAGPRDALVKLRRNGATELAFYVRARESGSVTSVADGTYQIMFASGAGFSRKCLEFTESMDVLADPNPSTFETRRERVPDGEMVYSSSAEYTLTLQSDGNFRPKNVDASAFRE